MLERRFGAHQQAKAGGAGPSGSGALVAATWTWKSLENVQHVQSDIWVCQKDLIERGKTIDSGLKEV